MTVLARLWREHRALLLAFSLAAALTLFFAVRFVVFTVYWADPAHRERQPEGWMTPGYIARSWDVSRDDLRAALDLPAEGKPPTLAQIARDRGEPLPAFLDEVAQVLAGLKASP